MSISQYRVAFYVSYNLQHIEVKNLEALCSTEYLIYIMIQMICSSTSHQKSSWRNMSIDWCLSRLNPFRSIQTTCICIWAVHSTLVGHTFVYAFYLKIYIRKGKFYVHIYKLLYQYKNTEFLGPFINYKYEGFVYGGWQLIVSVC